MRRFYGINLSGVFAYPPTVEPQEILWLYEQLPDDAAVKRDPTGDGGQWELHNLLLAMVLNAIQMNTHAFVVVNSKKGNAPKAPKPVLPPGLQEKEAPVPTITAINLPEIGLPKE